MGTINYNKYLVYHQRWINNCLAKYYIQYVIIILQRYLKSKD